MSIQQLSVVVMIVLRLPVSKTTPFTGNRGELVSFVKLDILDRVAQADFVDSSAAHIVSMHLDNWQSVDQLFRV